MKEGRGVRGITVGVPSDERMIDDPCVKVLEGHRPLPDSDGRVQRTLVGSWHRFEQWARLFVPNARARSWNTKAASLLVRPDV